MSPLIIGNVWISVKFKEKDQFSIRYVEIFFNFSLNLIEPLT
jgi:hypothetical protein